MAATVVIVDDDVPAARAIAASLVDAGYRTIMAEDPVQAMTVIRRESPDLILLDLTLPGGGGLPLLARLLSIAATSMTPVIVMSESPGAAMEAMRTGARTTLAKPIDPPALLDAIDAHISSPGALVGAPQQLLEDAARLRAVHEIGGLDGPSDATLDRFTRIASLILEVPAAQISLVDVDRQFFRSQSGLSEPWATRRHSPLSHSFCQFAVAFREPLVINDARTHPLVSSSPAIAELNVIAYAGVPLITTEGHAIGSLCVTDSQPRSWSDADVDVLRDLAAILMELLELRQGRTSPVS